MDLRSRRKPGVLVGLRVPRVRLTCSRTTPGETARALWCAIGRPRAKSVPGGASGLPRLSWSASLPDPEIGQRHDAHERIHSEHTQLSGR